MMLLGAAFTIKITSADTGGAFALIEYIVPPHSPRPQTHWHNYTMEWLYVVEGMLACTLGEQTITAISGTMIVVPPKVVHGVWNPTAAPVQFLSLVAPGTYDHYLQELTAMFADTANWRAVNMAQVEALAARHDILRSG